MTTKLIMIVAAVAAAFGAWAETETVGGYTWTYRINGDTAEIGNGRSVAISPSPRGAVIIPSTLGGKKVTRIGDCAFDRCTNLTSVTILDGVADVGESAFLGCRSLTAVTMPDSLTSIGDYAFYGCRSLTSVTIPKNVADVGERAFSDCGSLKRVTIGNNVGNIGQLAFFNCSGLKSFNVAEGNHRYKSVSGLLLTYEGKTLVHGVNGSVMVPNGVTNIDNGAFSRCSGLTTVTIPDSVTSIGGWAFSMCNGLKGVTIPYAVKGIGDFAFSGCKRLTSVTMRGERPETKGDIFTGCKKLKSICVPANAKSWAGMKKWQGIPLVFDGKDDAAHSLTDTTQEMSVAAKKLQSCGFLINKDFKLDAKVYLCLFSASWCPPCRREMPRIAKTYAETLKGDSDIELIHFSCDQNDEKALAWAKEHDVQFPVVRPKGGNPLDLHTRGIPHLFIVKADGTLVEEGHPMKLFTDEKLRELKAATP